MGMYNPWYDDEDRYGYEMDRSTHDDYLYAVMLRVLTERAMADLEQKPIKDPLAFDESLSCKVPPFDGAKMRKPVTYTWWAWHPKYPYWSRTRHVAESQDDAMSMRTLPAVKDDLDTFALALVRQDGNEYQVILTQNPAINDWKDYIPDE